MLGIDLCWASAGSSNWILTVTQLWLLTTHLMLPREQTLAIRTETTTIGPSLLSISSKRTPAIYGV